MTHIVMRQKKIWLWVPWGSKPRTVMLVKASRNLADRESESFTSHELVVSREHRSREISLAQSHYLAMAGEVIAD
jgi:hypothetical protein